MNSSPEGIKKHLRLHWIVGGALATFTLITVLLSVVPALDFGAPGTTAPDIVLALGIAILQSSLVMLIFMHLNHERGLIYKMILFTAIFAGALMVLTLLSQWDHVPDKFQVMDKVAGEDRGPRGTGEGTAQGIKEAKR